MLQVTVTKFDFTVHQGLTMNFRGCLNSHHTCGNRASRAQIFVLPIAHYSHAETINLATPNLAVTWGQVNNIVVTQLGLI